MFKLTFRTTVTFLFTGLTVLVLFSSCVSSRKYSYFNDLPKVERTPLPDIEWPVNVIQKDDILEIKISGKNEVTALEFNRRSTGFAGGLDGQIPQYRVDKDGQIDLYLVGKIRIDGLTESDAKIKIEKTIKPYLLEPIVNVRILNFRFSVLGEVKNPGSYSIPNEKISILEAMGYAGDMTGYAVRNNVRVYRDSSGVREVGMVNFNQKNIFISPFFYLKRNDVVYVESNMKLRQTDITFQRLSLSVGIISSLLAILVILKI